MGGRTRRFLQHHFRQIETSISTDGVDLLKQLFYTTIPSLRFFIATGLLRVELRFQYECMAWFISTRLMRVVDPSVDSSRRKNLAPFLIGQITDKVNQIENILR